MENEGKAGVITLESLMNAEPLSSEELSDSKIALEKEMSSKEEVLPGLEDLEGLKELEDISKEDKDDEEDKGDSEGKIKKDFKDEDEDIIIIDDDKNKVGKVSSEVSDLYKETLKNLWGADEISTIIQVVDGEETEVSLDDIELDEETFKLINQAKIDELKEEAVKDKISINGVSEFTQALIEIDKNGGDVRSLLEVKQAYSDPLDGLDLDNPQDQAQIVYLRGLAANQNESDIKRLIKSYTEEGILEEMAQKAESELRSAVDAKIQDELRKAEEDKKEREELFKAYKKSVKEVINNKFELKDSYKNKLIDMATKIDPEKKTYELDTKYQEWRLDPDKASELALLMYDREEFIKQVTRKAVQNEKLEAARKLKIVPRSSKIPEAQKTQSSNRSVHISDLK